MEVRPEQSGSPVIVAIVSYGRSEEVIGCLSALARSSLKSFEVVVVENGGAAAFDRLAANYGVSGSATARDESARVRVADPQLARSGALRWLWFWLPGGQPVLLIEACDNLGYGAGVNLAIRCLSDRRHWRGIWILNPDTEPESNAMEAVAEYAARGEYGLVGCRLVFAGRDRIQMRGGRWRPLIARGLSIGHGEPSDSAVDVEEVERRVQWISGAALYATRDFVKTVGLMNEKFFLYCEDVDWSLRRGKFRLGYAHDAVVHHAHGTTIGSATIKRLRSDLSVYLTERNSLLLTHDRFPRLYPAVVLVTLFLTLDYLIRGNWRVFIAACRGWWAGVRGETGRPGELA